MIGWILISSVSLMWINSVTVFLGITGIGEHNASWKSFIQFPNSQFLIGDQAYMSEFIRIYLENFLMP